MTIRQAKYFFELTKLLGYNAEEAKEHAKAKFEAEHFNDISVENIAHLIHIMEEQCKIENIPLRKGEPQPEPIKHQQALSEPKEDFPSEFRAWDKKTNQMILDVKCPDVQKYLEHHVMQFTGRLDKNGVKIFDFDFVKSYTGKLYIVQWSWKDCAWVVYPEDSNDDFYLASLGEVTVVGNVYEGVGEEFKHAS
jgi:YopX protein